MIRVLLAEDHALVRQGFGRLIAAAGDMTVVAEAATVRDALTLTARHAPDVIVLDLNLGTERGEQVLDALAHETDAPAVLAVSMDADAATIRRLKRRGASGFVPKDEAVDRLVVSIRAAAGGAQPSAATPS